MKDIPPLTANRIRDYWAKVDKSAPSGCWIWTGAYGSHGYGVMGFAGKAVQAKHIALILDGRPRPAAPNHHALHGPCSDRRCINPAHLRWGSALENVQDAISLGRQAKGERLNRSNLTEVDIRAIRESGESQSALGRRYGVTQSAISRIKTGARRSWDHVVADR